MATDIYSLDFNPNELSTTQEEVGLKYSDEDTAVELNNEILDDLEYHRKRVKELKQSANNSLIEKLHENAYKIDEKSDAFPTLPETFKVGLRWLVSGSQSARPDPG